MSRRTYGLLSALIALGCAGAPKRPASTPPDAVAAVAGDAVAPPSPDPVAVAALPESSTAIAEPEPEPDPTGAVDPAAPVPVLPLPAEHAAIFLASPQDESAEERGGVTYAQEGKHYVAGNEKTPHAFYPHVHGIGGGYVGVGSDQAYLLMGWIRPEVAWLIDYDAEVVAVHEVYRIFFDHAETPEAMLALWTKAEKERAAQLIMNAHPGRAGKVLRRLYLTHRGWIERRLVAVGKRLQEAGVPTFLDDQDTYDFIRSMLAAGRVRPLLANLLEDKGVRGVAEAAREMGVAIRVLYLSNAEEYWQRYDGDFRKNVAALPFGDDAKILRTLLIWDVNEDYRYNVQPASNFLEWLAQPYTRNVYDIVYRRGQADPAVINVFETNDPPQDSPASRRARS